MLFRSILGGAGTALSIADMNRRLEEGDIPGAMLSGAGGVFGTMSMVPPVHPLAMAIKGIGTAGSLATIPPSLAYDWLKEKYFPTKSVMEKQKK